MLAAFACGEAELALRATQPQRLCPWLLPGKVAQPVVDAKLLWAHHDQVME